VAAVVAGCSYPSSASPHPGECATLEPVVWNPAGFSTGAPTDVVIRVQFDDYPDPETVRSDSLLLTTGFFWVPASYGVDLPAKTATLRPWSPLSPDLGYTIHLMPRLASLSGCPAPYTTREFRTGSGPASTPAPAVPPFSDVQAIFDGRCGGSGCHLDSGACSPQPASALSLCDAEAWDALVGVASRQDGTLLRVRPGASASSYLLRKLLPATTGDGPPPPTLGHRDPPDAPLDDAEIATIAAWIDGGALH
jgi:hypothetical protein